MIIWQSKWILFNCEVAEKCIFIHFFSLSIWAFALYLHFFFFTRTVDHSFMKWTNYKEFLCIHYKNRKFMEFKLLQFFGCSLISPQHFVFQQTMHLQDTCSARSYFFRPPSSWMQSSLTAWLEGVFSCMALTGWSGTGRWVYSARQLIFKLAPITGWARPRGFRGSWTMARGSLNGCSQRWQSATGTGFQSPARSMYVPSLNIFVSL